MWIGVEIGAIGFNFTEIEWPYDGEKRRTGRAARSLSEFDEVRVRDVCVPSRPVANMQVGDECTHEPEYRIARQDGALLARNGAGLDAMDIATLCTKVILAVGTPMAANRTPTGVLEGQRSVSISAWANGP